jgi:hypothetical protein
VIELRLLSASSADVEFWIILSASFETEDTGAGPRRATEDIEAGPRRAAAGSAEADPRRAAAEDTEASPSADAGDGAALPPLDAVLP